MRATLLAASALLFPASATFACSCIGNNSYCETLAPDWFVNPEATALVVKLSTVEYGITVKVVQTLNGATLRNDTITVWGDNGGLCRIYLTGIQDGDTLVLGLNTCDLMGNSIWNPDYPPDLESAEDYQVSGCGVYALNYNNGQVVGAITAAGTQSMSWQEFGTTVNECALGTGVEEHAGIDPLSVAYGTDGPWLALAHPMQVELAVFDAMGRACVRTNWDGTRRSFEGLAAGTYMVQVRKGDERWVRKIVVSAAR
ncbi:MAG TPA: T9SS type A sorting domain-containing protein [Flavobacteriales bacterium]|jgi:hypothetical protein|nr:T9SS type A sorting domain-containing protein [Flavobacteriales bacterium]